MKLSYRGNPYNTETALLEVKETDITCKYRGSEWTYKLPKHIPQLQPKLYLQYRGIAYSTCTNSNIKPYFAESSETESNSSTSTTSQVMKRNLAQIHLKNLCSNLERRLKIAQENQNYHLLEMLKKESQELLCQCD